MTIGKLLYDIDNRGISVDVKNEKILLKGNNLSSDNADIVKVIKSRKDGLLETISSLNFTSNKLLSYRIADTVESITPSMLPLVELRQEKIDEIVASVPGGASNVQDIYPLAPLQEGVLYHHLSADIGDPYLVWSQLAFDSREPLDRFLAALQLILDRHDIMRTSIAWEGLSDPVQVVWRQAKLPVEEIRLDSADGLITEQLQARFDPTHYRLDVRQAPLVSAKIAYDELEDRWIVILLNHHLVGDSVTMQVLIEEVQVYLLGEAASLPLPVPYRDYVISACLGRNERAEQTFFKKMLGDVNEPTLPFGLKDVQGNSSAIGEANILVNADLSDRVRLHARRQGVSSASIIHLAFGRMLASLSGQDDVVFGTVLLGRFGGAAEHTLGMLINTLPLRLNLTGQMVHEALLETQSCLAGLLVHEHASLAVAQRCSGVASPLPLFSALLNYRHDPLEDDTQSAASAFAGMVGLGNGDRSNYPLSMDVDDFGVSSFGLKVQALLPIEASRVCAYMHETLSGLVQALDSDTEQSVLGLDILPADERHLLLQQSNATDTDYPADKCIHHLFEEQTIKTPDAVAVVQGELSLSYSALNAQANQLAHHLLSLGVNPDDRVAICAERSIEMVVGLLGILKAGGAYVPLDPDYPTNRLAYMFKDSSPVALLTHGQNLPEIGQHDIPTISLDTLAAWRTQATHTPKPEYLSSHNLAYVIYTSGSTGRPKGVMVEHRGVVNQTAHFADSIDLQLHDRMLQFCSLSFDASVEEIFSSLTRGASLILRSDDWLVDASGFWSLCDEYEVNIADLPTKFWEMLARAQLPVPESLRHIVIGGEQVNEHAIKAWFAQNRYTPNLINTYGPTETTVVATSGKVTDKVSPHIGQPIANTQIYLLDSQGCPVPMGAAGEIYIGGAGVARGYLNQPELTKQYFVDDPFSAEPDARMYKTGDIAKYLADGNIEYLGRNDFQVKVRGFRIELGEIEAQLLAHDQVQQSAVLARKDTTDDKTLVAYYTGSASTEALRAHVQASLPAHMVPSAYVNLENLPLTPNGKLDRKALPNPKGDAFVRAVYEAPIGLIEETIAGIWCDLLNLERVSRHDNFFTLGGHSLLAVRLAERLRQNKLKTDIKTLFAQPTLKALAATAGCLNDIVVPANGIVDGCKAIKPSMLSLVDLNQDDIDRLVDVVPGGAANIQDIYPLTPLQEGMLYHHLSAEAGDPYLLWLQMAFDSRDRLDQFLAALQSVLDRHDILRTGFGWKGLADPVQVVWRHAELPIEEITFNPANGPISEQLKTRFNSRHYRLDLQQAPLMVAKVAFDEPEDRWILMLPHHHLASDHECMVTIGQEVAAHLQGKQALLPTPVPYRDYVARACLGRNMQAEEAFFQDMLGDVDEPTLPYGLDNVQNDGDGIAEASLPVEAGLSDRVRLQSQRLGVSAASVFHLAFGRVLASLSDRDDVVFGTMLLGRQGGVAEQTLGMFLNTLPLRLTLNRQTVREAVLQTQQRLADLLGHEHASLAQAQRCSGIQAPLPLFSALLNYRHNLVDADTQAPDYAGFSSLDTEERSNYPLSLSVDDFGVSSFGLTVQALLPVEASRVCTYMHEALSGLVHALENEADHPVMELSILPTDEQHLLLNEWNATNADYPADQCIHHLFEQQAKQTPDAIAVVHDELALSYSQLDAQANQLAHYLLALGVNPDDRVAICAERSIELVVGLLGIVKAGGAYVPLNPAYPKERLAYMLEDSTPVALLTHGVELPEFGQNALALVPLNQSASWRNSSIQPPKPYNLNSRNLAYVIYTSGSTGQPKGVMIEHRGLTNLVTWHGAHFKLQTGERAPLTAGVAFDASTWEIWPTLCTGGTLIAPPAMVGQDSVALLEWLHHQSIDTAFLATPLAQLALTGEGLNGNLRCLLIGGDALNRVPSSLPEGLTLVNNYGPTETTVVATSGQLVKGGVPHIGRPISNTHIYLLDSRGHPVPVGAVGELYIGGAGVARGYHNQPELTEQRFVNDPFSSEPDARMYRTGDLCRYSPDGNIEFLGRNDFQIKVRGFRIELGEIEAQLLAHDQVHESTVLAREDDAGEKTLIAYFTGRANKDDLRAHLQASLPAYMVPAAYVNLEALPLTLNGKLDRNALPDPEGEAFVRAAYEAPIGPIEDAIAGIWCELLNLDRVSRHDNFFTLGGHSLLAVRLAERLRQVELSADIKTLFAQPTLKALAASTGHLNDIVVPANGIVDNCDSITPAMLPLVDLNQDEIDQIVSLVPGGTSNVQDIYPLAPLQEGVLYHYLSADNGDPYLLSSQMAFDTRDHLDRFLAALQQVLNRHDILRTGIVWEGLNDPVQVVQRHAELPIEQITLDPADGAITEQLEARFNPREFRLDVRQAPLIETKIAQDQDDDRWILMLLFQHMAVDHEGMEIIANEVMTVLHGEAASLPLPMPYRDYVARTCLGRDEQAEETFFQDMLGDVDEPTLPYALSDVLGDGQGVGEASLLVQDELSDRLRELAKRLGVSVASVFHLAFARVLASLSGRNDVVFGTVLLGRQGGVAEQAMGMFLNTLPLRLTLDGQTVSEAVLETQRRLAGLLGHEHASLALAQRCSGVPAPAPLFSALLNYRHNAVGTDSQASAFSGMDGLNSEEHTNYPLNLDVDDWGVSNFGLTVQALLPVEASRVCAYMHKALNSLVLALENEPDQPVIGLPILPADEQHLLLKEWNATATDYPTDQCNASISCLNYTLTKPPMPWLWCRMILPLAMVSSMHKRTNLRIILLPWV